jgi:hypothetical protein
VGSARDNPRLEEGEMKAHLVEQDGLSDQEAEAQITEWEEKRTQDDIFVEHGPKDTLVWSWVESGGAPDREHESWATPEITVEWSPVTDVPASQLRAESQEKATRTGFSGRRKGRA